MKIIPGRAAGTESERRSATFTGEVWGDPGERHWHGGDESTRMAHVAISLGGHDWLEPVTDEEYLGAGSGDDESV
jgi:hypothetical protein